jgi:hypothetical protein
MLLRIFTSGWFAALMVIAAAGALAFLYMDGKTTEALVGCGLLILAVILILLGGSSTDKSDDDMNLRKPKR